MPPNEDRLLRALVAVLTALTAVLALGHGVRLERTIRRRRGYRDRWRDGLPATRREAGR